MYIYPDFVPAFACEMCGLCCRNDWQVTVDEASYRRNETLFVSANKTSEFHQAFLPLETGGSPGEYAAIAKKEGGCWFLDDDNRCSLHLAGGHSHLDAVCQTYPRYPIHTERGWDVTLSFSCPAVLKLVNRHQPLQFIRAEDEPLAFLPEAAVAQVFPSQQRSTSVLRYYFELEQHFIDILQFRSLPLTQRLNFLQSAAAAISDLAGSDDLGGSLRSLIYSHYDRLDSLAGEGEGAESEPVVTAEILAEHFFVNLVFKKVPYLYGLQTMAALLERLWQTIAASCRGAADSADELSRARAAIMDLELRYSHNRQALLGQAAKPV